jgi:hypothetical protein
MEYPLDWERLEELKKSYERRGRVELVWMTPNEFLSKVPHPLTALVSALSDLREEYFNKGSLWYILEAITSERKLEPLVLDYTSMWFGYPSHEGRHRAFVAKKLGMEKVPVLVVR